MANSLLKTQTLTLLFSMFTAYAWSQSKSIKDTMNNEQKTVCSNDCKAQNKTGQMSCNLTTPELQSVRKL